MSDPLDNNVKAAIKAFEDADDLFRAEPGRIFGSENERKRALFGALTQKWKAWERSGPCMYRDCGNASTVRSHSIHRAGPIEQIAEQQHVLTPAFGRNGMGMNRVGVREASTFPGFCETHEQLFSSFENARKIGDGHQTVLQAFRTLCREIARKRHDVEHGRHMMEEFGKARFNYFKTSILEASPGAEVNSVSEEGNELEEFANSLLDGAEAALKELEGELYDELFQYVAAGHPEPCVQALEIPKEITLQIPVALSGLGVLNYRNAAGKHRALCLLGILPQEETTLMFIGAARRHCEAISMYVGAMQSGFGVLNAMERWMVYGSDHWFITPSVWDSIPAARRSTILKAIEGDDHDVGSIVPFSILDNARIRLISYIRDHITETDDSNAALRQLTLEEEKLAP